VAQAVTFILASGKLALFFQNRYRNTHHASRNTREIGFVFSTLRPQAQSHRERE
jgi:hypothetical protein